MQCPSPLILLLLFIFILNINLALSAPLPATHSPNLDCTTTPRVPCLLHLLTTSLKSQPRLATLLYNDFPLQQCSTTPKIAHGSERIEGLPTRPSTLIPPNRTLASDRPLETAYLRSLSNPAVTPETQHVLCEKEFSAAEPEQGTILADRLSKSRKEDAKRYWRTMSKQNPEFEDGPDYSKEAGSQQYEYCRDVHVEPQPTFLKAYPEFIVVGAVVFFLVTVAVMESLEMICKDSENLCRCLRGADDVRE